MPLQYNEYYHKQTGLTVGVNRLLYSHQSDYQLVEVYETDTWGNLMTIDGMVMLSEKDEFVYHEMLTHVAMFTHPSPERVLVIGGGDGGTAREVLKHTSVLSVDLVEIDKTVVDASKEYFPGVGDFDNKRLNVIHEDGTEFIRQVTDPYDVIIVDGSDPVGPAEGLFEKPFFSDCSMALGENGVLATQTESPWIEGYHESIRNVNNAIKFSFSNSYMYLCSIPLYPSGLWSMMCGAKSGHPLDQATIERVEAGVSALQGLRYYNLSIHKASFALPGFVAKLIE